MQILLLPIQKWEPCFRIVPTSSIVRLLSFRHNLHADVVGREQVGLLRLGDHQVDAQVAHRVLEVRPVGHGQHAMMIDRLATDNTGYYRPSYRATRLR